LPVQGSARLRSWTVGSTPFQTGNAREVTGILNASAREEHVQI
jgi:hypothetical protein